MDLYCLEKNPTGRALFQSFTCATYGPPIPLLLASAINHTVSVTEGSGMNYGLRRGWIKGGMQSFDGGLTFDIG